LIQRQFQLNTVQFEPSPVYSVPCFFRIEGALDAARLEDAWTRVFRGSAWLGAALVEEGDRALLAVDPACPAPWSVVECPPGMDEGSVTDLARAETERPFELARPPLSRMVLFRIGSDRHYILLVQHHIITDLAAKRLLVEHLARAYADPGYLPPAAGYGRHVAAERSFLAGPAGAKAQEFWRGRMRNGAETLRLPMVRQAERPFQATGRQADWRLPDGLSRLLAAAETAGHPVFLTMLTAYACTLGRLSGQGHFRIAVPFSNRPEAMADVMGPCINVLPLDVEIRPGDSFTEIRARLRQEMLLAHRHQALPFLEIAQHFDEARNPSRPRLLQAGFTQEPLVGLDLPGLRVMPLHLPRQGAQMDLFFTWWPDGSGWSGVWEYNDQGFGPEEVRYWQGAFDRLLDSALTTPDRRWDEVGLVDGEWTRRMTGEAGGEVFDHDANLADCLRAGYARDPGRPALRYRQKTWSYAEWARSAERVAGHVREQCGHGQRVLVLTERGSDMVLALHGIVLSGNAYVPLGTDWPLERIATILEDIEPSLVITQAQFAERFSGAVCPVRLINELAELPATPLPRDGKGTGPGDAIYILYTSGTTGRPKGVEVPHRGVAGHVRWMQERYGLGAGERCMLKTPYTFDVSVWELFWPFWAGACLVVPEEGAHKDPREMLELAVGESVNRLDFVPSMLEPFLEQPGLERLTALTDLHCIGEALPPALADRCGQALPGVRLHNLYGPTEASVAVSYWLCGAENRERGTVPIGFPMANAQMYVLDPSGRLCPPLVKGEILIGGSCLAKGYWRRPELTAAKFVANPYGPGKLYRTGDWGRYALDGAIEYLERQDTQTKIRGVRLELAEIETRMRQIDGIENAVVKKGQNFVNQECLIAYYLLRPGADASAESIREQLRACLPEAIVPDYLIRLDTFPISENGKLDRKALPDRVGPSEAAKPQRVVLRDELEEQVADLWRQVVGHDCDPERNFFDVGGNSMSLLVLRRLLEETMGAKVTVAQLFQHPTVSGMAALFRPKPDDAARNDAVERARQQRERMKGYAPRDRRPPPT
jgi:amino acid adenylation domain-containing protein